MGLSWMFVEQQRKQMSALFKLTLTKICNIHKITHIPRVPR